MSVGNVMSHHDNSSPELGNTSSKKTSCSLRVLTVVVVVVVTSMRGSRQSSRKDGVSRMKEEVEAEVVFDMAIVGMIKSWRAKSIKVTVFAASLPGIGICY
jgi:hypothetical protein